MYMVMNPLNIFSQINNDLIEYAVNEIESAFNNEYGVFHENVIIVIGCSHSIDLHKLNKTSKILNYEICLQNELDKSSSNFKCNIEKTLSLYFIHGHYSKIKPSVYIPDLISFNSNASKVKSLSGNLYPEFLMINGIREYVKPKTFFICSFDVEE
jgi:hypothetical protein